MFFFLQSYLKSLVERYPELFEGNPGDGSESSIHTHNFSKKWGSYTSIVSLANEDVTKFDVVTSMELEQCLLYLSYKADKNQLEGIIHRQAMAKYKRK